jgi:DNA invertase Pin-like site-specific DNA recombinase
MNFGYKRVSSAEQNSERQLLKLELDRTYEDKLSGKSVDRPQLQALLLNLRSGDVVHVHELSRLGRSVKDLLNLVEQITELGCTIKFHKENLEFTGDNGSPFQKLMLNLFSSIAQFERELLLERQREGIALAKAKGKYTGRRSKFSTEDKEQIKLDMLSDLSKNTIAQKWGVSRRYLYTLAS